MSHVLTRRCLQWIMAFQLVMQAFGNDWMRQMSSVGANGSQRGNTQSRGFMPRVGGGWFGGSSDGSGKPGPRAPSSGWQVLRFKCLQFLIVCSCFAMEPTSHGS